MKKFIPTYLKITEIINSSPNDAEAEKWIEKLL